MRSDLEKWLDIIEQDRSLSEKLLISKMNYEQEKKSFNDFICDKFIPEAEKHGFNFSLDDVVGFSQANRLQELSVDDLEDVSGGSAKTLMAAGAVAMSLLSAIPVAYFMGKESNNIDLPSTSVSMSEKQVSQDNNEEPNTNASGQILRDFQENQSAKRGSSIINALQSRFGRQQNNDEGTLKEKVVQ